MRPGDFIGFGQSCRQHPRGWRAGYAELFTPRTFDLTTFPNDEGYDELVISRNLPLRSVCEHHMLPFVGIAHIGYLPGERIIGLSKLARVAEHFACRPQRQERLTKQIADWLDAQLQPRGVGVVIEAEHTCMTLQGVQAAGSATITSTLLGALREDSAITPGVLRTHRGQHPTNNTKPNQAEDVMTQRRKRQGIAGSMTRQLPEDGTRVLVDRIWPRGVSVSPARSSTNGATLAPSTELRKWYSHDPALFE